MRLALIRRCQTRGNGEKGFRLRNQILYIYIYIYTLARVLLFIYIYIEIYWPVSFGRVQL